jgi:ABC-type thiamine transport system substrate-binding protein
MEMIYWVRFYGLCTTLIVLLMAPLVAVAQGSPDQKIVDAAKKEGELVYYTTMTLDQSKMVVDRFQKKYGIKATLFRTGGGPLLNKIFTEARGGRYDWDIVVGRGEMVLPLIERKLVASYRSPETKMIEAELVDKEGYWTAYYVNSYVLGWNTQLVKKPDVPKTYEELLNPKWKGGQISVDTEAYGMLEGLKRVWGKEKAVGYFKRLAALDPVLKRGNTERVQLVVAGEYPLILAVQPDDSAYGLARRAHRLAAARAGGYSSQPSHACRQGAPSKCGALVLRLRALQGRAGDAARFSAHTGAQRRRT